MYMWYDIGIPIPEVSAVKVNQPRTNDKTAKPLLRRWMMGAAVLGMAAVTALAGVYDAPTEGAEEAAHVPVRNERIVMYMMDAPGLELPDANADKTDQINYSFALIEAGEATGRHWRGIRQFASFMKRHPEIDGVLSVGGWGAEGFSDACATEEGRQRLADSILRLMDEHGFVGVDIDWEYPGSGMAGIKNRPEDVENWYALLELLRAGLDERQNATGRDHLLSVALGAGDAQLRSVDGARLNKLVDQAVVMAYDLSGFDKITGHHAGLYPDEDRPASGAHAVRTLADSGLASGKLLLGIPAYARVWRQVSGGDGLNQRAATAGNKTLNFAETSALESQGYAYHYDESARAAWWFNGENFVSGESADSIDAKAMWIKANGLLGTAVWSWNQDSELKLLSMLDAALQP